MGYDEKKGEATNEGGSREAQAEMRLWWRSMHSGSRFSHSLEGGAMAFRSDGRLDGLLSLHRTLRLRLLNGGGAERQCASDRRIVLLGLHEDSAEGGEGLQVVQVRGPAEAVLLPLVRQEPLRIHMWCTGGGRV